MTNFDIENDQFCLDATRNVKGNFAFDGSFFGIEDGFAKIQIVSDDPGKDCIVGSFTSGRDFLEFKSVDCQAQCKVICRRWQQEIYSCESNGQLGSRKKRSEDPKVQDIGSHYTLDLLLNPMLLRDENSRAIALKREYYKNMFRKVKSFRFAVLKTRIEIMFFF